MQTICRHGDLFGRRKPKNLITFSDFTVVMEHSLTVSDVFSTVKVLEAYGFLVFLLMTFVAIKILGLFF